MVLGLLLREVEEKTLEFDFESFLPDDSVEKENEEANGSVVGTTVGGVTIGMKKDFKRGTVVCRHWLRGLCMKGDNCEFLHQYDMSKMPECRWGMECQVPECPFRHVPDEDRVECAFYKQGFCSHGPNCRYRHIKLAREECPESADFGLQSKLADEESAKRRKTQPVNEFFKIAICKHWEKLGSCPFGDECHFAHGEQELRPYPTKAEGSTLPKGSSNEQENVGTIVSQIELPDEGKNCKYFVLKSYSYKNLVQSVHDGVWAVSRTIKDRMRVAIVNSESVFLFMSVTPSKHFQGVARVVEFTPNDDDSGEEDLSISSVTAENERVWNGSFRIEWLKICELQIERVLSINGFPSEEMENGRELNQEYGHALMRLVFDQPQIQLHFRSVEDEHKLPGGSEELANRRRLAAEVVHGAPLSSRTARWKVNGPAFVFACNNTTIDECFGRMIFGLAKDQEYLAAKNVVPGMPLFLLNMSDRHVLGIFEAVSPSIVNMIPGAFSHAPHVPSPFPVQTRFIVQLHAPAIPATDPQVKQIFGERGVRIGPLSMHTTQRLADVFAERCGAVFPDPNQAPAMHSPQNIPFSHPTEGLPIQAGSASTSSDAPNVTKDSGLVEKMVVGIENDSEFNATRRIIGHSGANMKRIVTEAGGNTRVQLRGRGSGVKEGGEESNEPLTVVVSADNECSFRIACGMTAELLGSIHHEYQFFLAQKHQKGGALHGQFQHFGGIPSRGLQPFGIMGPSNGSS